MELLLPIFNIISTLAFICVFGITIQLYHTLILKPARLRSKLRKQGIRGPPPSSFLLGNLPEIRNTKASRTTQGGGSNKQVITHNCSSTLFPCLEQWRKEYGPTFMFSLGNMQILLMNHPDIVKEITTCTSLDLGKPSYQQKQRGPLFGQGILTSNGVKWERQRKILAPELYMEKVKGLTKHVVESSVELVNSWTKITEDGGGIAEIKIDPHMKKISGEVIAKACFGKKFLKGQEIFRKLRALEEIMSKRLFSSGIPLLRYIPTKSNREIWRLEKEVRTSILKVVKERKEATSEKNLLQMILEGAENSGLNQDATDSYIVDNCKSVYLAGYEATAVCSTWTLMLLASNPEWQDRVRAEVLAICQGQVPDPDMIRKMKTLTMVIHESLRLYPPACLVSREALQDMKFGDIHVPKGVNIWTLMVKLHQDPEIWGPDANKFNPERFANGVSGACKLPYVYMPFGVGPRTCLGQFFAMAELKILMSIIISNFSFTMSPKYVHSPVQKLVIEPEFGVDVLIRKL